MNIGLLGFGAVGKETAMYLLKKNPLAKRSKKSLHLKKIFTRSPQKITAAKIHKNLISKTWQDIVEDPTIDCVIELIGGIQLPYRIIKACLNQKKHVITANKALLALHGKELLSLASKNNVCISFEASCGGGIPIIRALTDGLIANSISGLHAIINGTCNFILSEMAEKEISFNEALHIAKNLGISEANPSLDIDGFDSGHKIAIMTTLSFNTHIAMDKISIVGIKKIQTADIMFAKRLGYTMKLIASATQIKDKVCVWVHPTLVKNTHALANIGSTFNAISVMGSEIGTSLYCGRGAGGKATSSSIIADAISIANGSASKILDTIGIRHDRNTANKQVGMHELHTEAYIRLNVEDRAGVLASITKIFQKYDISIFRILQEDFMQKNMKKRTKTVPLIIITHHAQWKKIITTCEKITILDTVCSTPVVYPIINVTEDI